MIRLDNRGINNLLSGAKLKIFFEETGLYDTGIVMMNKVLLCKEGNLLIEDLKCKMGTGDCEVYLMVSESHLHLHPCVGCVLFNECGSFQKEGLCPRRVSKEELSKIIK